MNSELTLQVKVPSAQKVDFVQFSLAFDQIASHFLFKRHYFEGGTLAHFPKHIIISLFGDTALEMLDKRHIEKGLNRVLRNNRFMRCLIPSLDQFQHYLDSFGHFGGCSDLIFYQRVEEFIDVVGNANAGEFGGDLGVAVLLCIKVEASNEF